jgi:DNA-binding NtrC family response regulator
MFAESSSQSSGLDFPILAPENDASGAPLKNYKVAVVDDDHREFFMLKYMLKKSHLSFDSIEHYSSLDDLLAADTPSPHVVLLDRHLPDSVLTESRIREIRARHNQCGVIMHTGNMTPSLRSTAAHEGAVAVVEKGSLDSNTISSLVRVAAMIGPQM